MTRAAARSGSPGLRLGKWSARAIAAFSVPYAITMVIGFSSMGNVRDPLPDPYLAVAELLILLMAPFMLTLMIAVHCCAPVRLRVFSLTAVGWMLLLAGVTMTVHFVELTFVRRINPAEVPGFDRLLDFQWPSLLYAADIAAWDLFLGLSLLFAAPVYTGARHRWARRGLVSSGVLCLLGLVGPCVRCPCLAGDRHLRLRGRLPCHVSRAQPGVRERRHGSGLTRCPSARDFR